VLNELPTILTYRYNTQLQFCYGATDKATQIPADWDSSAVKVIPLWEGGSSLFAIRLVAHESEFIQINYEDPNDIEVISTSSNGLFAYLFYFLVESLDDEDEEELADIKRLATDLEFDKLDLIFGSVKRISSEPDYESLWELTRSL
jgi:hypothetical protein